MSFSLNGMQFEYDEENSVNESRYDPVFDLKDAN